MCKICYPAICCFLFTFLVVRKINRCGHLRRHEWQPPPAVCSRLQSCSFFSFRRARWDAQLTHNPQTHTEAYTNTDIQVPDVLLHSLASDLQRSWSIVAQKRGKQTNKQVRNATLKTHAKNNIYCSVDHPPCFHRFQLTIPACSGSLKR